ncbi:MAG TPA: ASPIC/UnbV domain-containing protein, partial [Candidatus Angelobacter sp.]|nr:ASPIC/UnbV domain-containing protein [Candidatus Angelobacter sp.]
AWPEARQTLRIYQNTLDDRGNWIGFRFREESGKPSPVGARVTLRYGGRSAVREIVTGDSYRSQHADTVHFGLGKADRVDRVEIKWVNGQVLNLREPAVNHYHDIRPPSENAIQR